MKYLLLLVVMCSSMMGQSYLQVCEKTNGPYPTCSGAKIGNGLELVDGEIRAIPTTNKYEIVIDYLVFDSADVSDGQPRTLADVYQDKTIVAVTWGLYALTKDTPNFISNCAVCWAEGLDVNGKRTLVFSNLVRNNPDKAAWAVVVKFASIK